MVRIRLEIAQPFTAFVLDCTTMLNTLLHATLTITLLVFSFPAHAGIEKFLEFNGDYSEEADVTYDAPNPSKLQVAWGAMTRPWTRNAVMKELVKPIPSLGTVGLNVNSLPFSRLDGKSNDSRNPFWINPGDFSTGTHLVIPSSSRGPVPSVAASETSWFSEQVSKGLSPDVFVIGGHHVISEGYHNDPETMFMYTPTLMDTIARVPEAREYFDHVKLAVLWGCNTLTNLEPHAANGDYLSPSQIEELYLGGSETRKQVIGSSTAVNTLEFYRSRLAREYGSWNKKHYEYTRDPRAERCEKSPGNPYLRCSVTNVDRILPDLALYDGDHKMNGAWIHKRIFRNAYLVLGFNSASPSEENRVRIFQAALDGAYASLNQGLQKSDAGYVHNLLREIVEDSTPTARRARLIQALRKSWTLTTYRMNRQRPSGSITPALPELDRDGMFPVSPSKDAPLYAPYEDRSKTEPAPLQ
jgi:hypothetical protein